MHIQEPTTQQTEAQFSAQSFQTVADQMWNPEVLQQHQQREQLLQFVRELVYSHAQLEPMLQTALAQIQQVLQIEQIAIYRFHPDSRGEIAFESVALASTSAHDWDIPDIIAIWRQIPGMRAFEVKTNLVIPILLPNLDNHQKFLWGLLIAHNSEPSYQWQDWKLESLKQLSTEIAIAIQQFQLWEQLQLAEAQAREASQQLQITTEELQYTQRQLLQTEKMANIGRLVADMANETHSSVNFINKNLQPVSQYAEDLIKLIELYQHHHPKPHPTVAAYLRNLDLAFVKTDFLQLLWSIRAGSERLQEIVFAWQNFLGLEESCLTKVNIHDGLESVLRILQPRLKEKPERTGIEVIKNFGELPLVECYAGELNQVFMNILTNAVDALEERMNHDSSWIPRIWIRTEIIKSHLSLANTHDSRVINQQIAKKTKVLVRIADNGKGILPHIQRKIFDPFFTTKPLGKAQGLGLSISQQIIVDKHQGKLKCNSQLGQGTEFVIEINSTAKHYIDKAKQASF